MSDDWEVPCSDDEKYDIKLCQNNKWEPPPEKILEIYEKLSSSEDGLISLSWTNPGRRPPTPESKPMDIEGKQDDRDTKQDIRDEYFDFEVDKGKVCLRPSGDVGPRGSAKKKTTSLDAILSNMARHRRLEMLDQDIDECNSKND